MPRYVGIDPGEKRIGIAVSDPEARIAFPREVVSGEGKLPRVARRLAELVRASEGRVVVVGLPLRMDGSRGAEADRASSLAALLRAQLQGLAEVVEWDERLTTAAAQRSLQEAGLDSRKQRKVVDSVAACLLLQSYLDFLARR